MYSTKDSGSQLADYIEKNLTKGYTLDALRFSLISQGYSRISVEKAIDTANKNLARKIPKIKEKPQITREIIPLNSSKENSAKKTFWKKLFWFFRK